MSAEKNTNASSSPPSSHTTKKAPELQKVTVMSSMAPHESANVCLETEHLPMKPPRHKTSRSHTIETTIDDVESLDFEVSVFLFKSFTTWIVANIWSVVD